MSEKVIVTGAAGFTGAILAEQLRQRGVKVYDLVRPHSPRNERLNRGDEGLHVIELDMDDIVRVKEPIPEGVSVFYHLAVTGNKDFSSQYVNVQHTLNAL